MVVNHKRRHLLTGSLATALSSGLIFRRDIFKGVDSKLTSNDLNTVLRRVTNPLLVGKRYLETTTLEARTDLERHLQNIIDSAVKESSEIPLTEKLVAAIERDYKSGNTLLLDGWIYSKMECTLCALKVAQIQST